MTVIQDKAISARSWAMLLLLGVIWGGSFFFSRIAVMEVEAFTLVLVRVSLASAALWLVMTAQGVRPSAILAMPLAFLGLGLLNNVIPFSLIFLGQTELGAGLASVLNATTPFWTIAIARMLTDDGPVARHRILGIGMGMAGTAVMLMPSLSGALASPLWAKLCVVAAALSYGAVGTYARRFKNVPPLEMAAGQLTGSTVLMIPLVLLFGAPSTLINASQPVLGAIVLMALVSTAFAYLLFFRLMRDAGPTNTSLVTLIVPVSAVLLGALFLGERLELIELGGMALILAGLLVIDGRLFSRR